MKPLKGEITLLSLGQFPCEFGLRFLSSVLKENHYSVKKLFLKQRFKDDVSLKIVEQINEFSRNSLFIGVSLMTEDIILARNFAKKIRQFNKDIILVGGGIHPTVRPDEIMDDFDIAVAGEAEETILMLSEELARGKRIKDIRLPTVNTKYHSSDEIGFVEDIDNLPYPDFSENFILKDGRVCLEKDYISLFGEDYNVLTSRGCPHACTYCVNSYYSENMDRRFFRKRSIGKIIDELRFAKERYKIKTIAFVSDNFLSFSERELNDFISLYGKEVNLPFVCVAAPNCIKEDHIKRLMDIGLFRIGVGVESGSENTLNQYKRSHSSLKKIVEVAGILHKLHPRLGYSFDFICDNPYETEDDLKKTISLLEAMPKTYDLDLFSLTFYPGTYLYDKAVQDGFIEDSYYLKKNKYYRRLNKSFYNFIILLYALKANPKLIDFFMRCEPGKGMVARVCKAIAANLTNVLLGASLLQMVMFSIRHKNKAMVFYYIKFGFVAIKSSLLRWRKEK
ncbi:B12-binding domain-containing radical SAM protein [Candidatus Omnitrophota bacterium]